MLKFLWWCKQIAILGILITYSIIANAQDTTNITVIDNVFLDGQSMIKVAARWAGILTTVGAVIVLDRGHLVEARAQFVCKIIAIIGLLVASISYFYI